MKKRRGRKRVQLKLMRIKMRFEIKEREELRFEI
jgi:hypothetical protein